MTLGAFIQTIDWVDVKAALSWLFPDDRKSLADFRRVFSQLRLMTPLSSRMRISVRTTFREGLDDTPFQEIIGRSGTLNRDLDDFEYLGQQPDSPFAFEETVFSFVLEPWDSWLGMHITEHAGPKKGRGGYAGRKYDAKRESDKARRQKSLILVDKDLDNFFDDRTHDKEDGQ